MSTNPPHPVILQALANRQATLLRSALEFLTGEWEPTDIDRARFVRDLEEVLKTDSPAVVAKPLIPTCPFCTDTRPPAVEREETSGGPEGDPNNGPIYYAECPYCCARGPLGDDATSSLKGWSQRTDPVRLVPQETVGKQYWLCVATEDDINVEDGPWSTWADMVTSPTCDRLLTNEPDDELKGTAFLITEPGKQPIIGGFRPGMKPL